MSQSDPMTALLSPNPNNASMQDKLNALNLKSPSAGGGSGFPGSPTVNQFLNPESALDAQARQSKLRQQNRISAPGTLQPSDRWAGHLDQVAERGTSPGADSNASSRSRSRSPQPDLRPKSTDYSGKDGRSPRVMSGVGLGLHQPVPEAASPVTSPFLNNASWASMVNTPLVPMFADPKENSMANALNMANSSLGRVALDDPRKYRRAGRGDEYDDKPQSATARASSPLARRAGSRTRTGLDRPCWISLDSEGWALAQTRMRSLGWASTLPAWGWATRRPLRCWRWPKRSSSSTPRRALPRLDTVAPGSKGMAGATPARRPVDDRRCWARATRRRRTVVRAAVVLEAEPAWPDPRTSTRAC